MYNRKWYGCKKLTYLLKWVDELGSREKSAVQWGVAGLMSRSRGHTEKVACQLVNECLHSILFFNQTAICWIVDGVCLTNQKIPQCTKQRKQYFFICFKPRLNSPSTLRVPLFFTHNSFTGRQGCIVTGWLLYKYNANMDTVTLWLCL
jgi:hypothetical protein